MASAPSERLRASANAHALIRRDVVAIDGAARIAELGALMRAVVHPHAAQDARNSPFDFDGPDVALGGDATNGIAVVVHELATNAAKYGALARAGGAIALHWRTAGDMLRIDWVEREARRCSRRLRTKASARRSSSEPSEASSAAPSRGPWIGGAAASLSCSASIDCPVDRRDGTALAAPEQAAASVVAAVAAGAGRAADGFEPYPQARERVRNGG